MRIRGQWAGLLERVFPNTPAQDHTSRVAIGSIPSLFDQHPEVTQGMRPNLVIVTCLGRPARDGQLPEGKREFASSSINSIRPPRPSPTAVRPPRGQFAAGVKQEEQEDGGRYKSTNFRTQLCR